MEPAKIWNCLNLLKPLNEIGNNIAKCQDLYIVQDPCSLSTIKCHYMVPLTGSTTNQDPFESSISIFNIVFTSQDLHLQISPGREMLGKSPASSRAPSRVKGSTTWLSKKNGENHGKAMVGKIPKKKSWQFQDFSRKRYEKWIFMGFSPRSPKIENPMLFPWPSRHLLRESFDLKEHFAHHWQHPIQTPGREGQPAEGEAQVEVEVRSTWIMQPSCKYHVSIL